MRKIKILKTLVDLIWIFSMPIVLIIICFSFAVFFIDLSDLDIKLNTIHFNQNNGYSKILFVISALNYLLIIAALYFFRDILTKFTRIKIFENSVITSFKKIGNLLLISGGLSIIVSIISQVYLEQKIALELGLNQHLIIICMGLFFLVLSEIFKIAKNTKQENDLTI